MQISVANDNRNDTNEMKMKQLPISEILDRLKMSILRLFAENTDDECRICGFTFL